MPVIEEYKYDVAVGARPCENYDPSVKQQYHYAEVIIHDGNGKEQFLCKSQCCACAGT
jgi:hypothetical protein